MDKTKSSICIAALLASMATAVGAAEPLRLSDSQMDSVAAGVQTSYAGGSASAWYGIVRSWSQASTASSGPVHYTTASSLNFAIGTGTTATAYAGSTF